MCAETEEDLKARHSQEKKDLVAQVTSLKRSFNKNDSKRKKEVQAQVQKLENDLKARHEKELNDLFSQTSTLKITEDKPVPQNEVKDEHGGEKKKTKAQKNREKKEEKDRRMREAMKQDALNAATGKGAIETDKIKGILEEQRLRLVDIPPDGDCMYNALADQLSIQDPTSTITGEEIRELTANHLIANKDTFLPFLGNGDLDDEGFQDYCNKVRNPCRDGGEWGGEPELQAISTALEKPVEVLHADGAPHCFGQNFAGPPLVLTYHRYAYTLGEHYNSTAKA